MTDRRKKRGIDEEDLAENRRTYKREILVALLIILLVIGIAVRVNQFFFGFDLPEIAFAGTTVAEVDETTGFHKSGDGFKQSEDWRLILVNREHPLEKPFSGELTELRYGVKVDSRIYPDLQAMFDEMRADGLFPRAVEGYRSSEEQQTRLDNKISEYMGYGKSREEAREMALRWVAEPGTCEHELGICVDISSESGENTSANDVWEWMDENCSRFGFIKRYPRDKVAITGVRGEQWHYRYVGEEAAQEISDRKITLEEYLGAVPKE